MFCLFLFFLFFRLSFGPQHPASHGVLTLIIYFTNEYILLCDIHIGYLHRGTEKLLEFKSCDQCLPYFDRLDYVSIVYNEHMFSLSFEHLLHVCIALRVSICRLLFLEFTSVFNGLLCLSCNVFDIGAISPLLWSFEERDNIMTFFDYVCGCSMHCAFICLMGCLDDISFSLLEYIIFLINSNLFLLELFDLVCINNNIVYLSLRGIGVFDFYDITYNSISGILASACGFLWDCSLFNCYEIYNIMNYDFTFSICGDAQDSFILRLFDMSNSLILLNQLCILFNNTGHIQLFELFTSDITIELIIYMFYMVWCICTIGTSLVSIESPNGEYSCCIMLFMMYCSSCSIRCADFIHVLLLDVLCNGYLLSDLVAIIGNIDCVFGSVDS